MELHLTNRNLTPSQSLCASIMFLCSYLCCFYNDSFVCCGFLTAKFTSLQVHQLSSWMQPSVQVLL